MEPANAIFLAIILSTTLFVVVFGIFAYRVFFGPRGSADGEYSYLSRGGGPTYGATNSSVPREFLNDEEALTHLAREYDFAVLAPEEQAAYARGEEFSAANPPNFQHARGASYTAVTDLAIRDRGIGAFEFEQDSEFLQPRFIVDDRTEVNFLNNDAPFSCSTAVLNYSLPVKHRATADIVYFEVKIFEYAAQDGEHFAVGLVTKPYPSAFRLPGYNNFSIAYESTGNLKINKPLPTPRQQHGDNSQHNALILPPLQQSDIVGFGYVISTGTIFLTHNGKKLMDIMKGCFADLYPAVGAFQSNCKFQVNVGQLGFVWIEANVRKYGFVSTNDYKKIQGERGRQALPEYANDTVDKVLDKGEELPPRYPEDELDFFGRSATGTSTSLNLGTSAQLEQKVSEKKEHAADADDDKEEEEKPLPANPHSSSTVTDEPEEIMDLRERIYEQRTQEEDADDESAPLLPTAAAAAAAAAAPPPAEDVSAKASSSDKDETPETEAETSPEAASPESKDPETTAAGGAGSDAADSSREATPSAAVSGQDTTPKSSTSNKKKKKKSGKKKGKKKK